MDIFSRLFSQAEGEKKDRTEKKNKENKGIFHKHFKEGEEMKLEHQLVEWMKIEELPIYEEPLIRDKVKYEIKQEGKLFAIFTRGETYIEHNKIINKDSKKLIRHKA
jgi:hypothetical protein